MSDGRDELLAANQAFYAAFSTADAPAMDALWAVDAPVTCEHPGMAALQGREAVMATWRRILGAGGAPGIHATDAVAIVDGPAGTVTCTERIEDGALSAVNGFVREHGAWRMTSHRASPG